MKQSVFAHGRKLMHAVSGTDIRITLVMAFLITVIFGTIYATVQQNIRLAGNDPQIQIARDAARALNNGADPRILFPPGTIDPSQSLAPFLIIYDMSGNPIASFASLNGAAPVPPHGVFDYVRTHGENRITWQPEKNVRIAAVIERYNAGFVLAGRSLKEIERRESLLEFQVGLAWLGSLFVLALFFISNRIRYPKEHDPVREP